MKVQIDWLKKWEKQLERLAEEGKNAKDQVIQIKQDKEKEIA